MEYKRIEYLLDNYWACKTTPEEEDELRFFYGTAEELPAHLEQFRELFVFQQQEREMHLTAEFDQRVLNEIRKSKDCQAGLRIRILRVVAVVVLLCSVGVAVVRQTPTEPGVEQSPEQILAEVQQALHLVASKLNEGQRLVEKNINEIEIMTRYIKQ